MYLPIKGLVFEGVPGGAPQLASRGFLRRQVNDTILAAPEETNPMDTRSVGRKNGNVFFLCAHFPLTLGIT